VQTFEEEEEPTENMTSLPVQNSNTKSETGRTTGGVPGELGYQFEIKMAALISLRALNKNEKFELSSNIQGAGKFDDIMYKTDDRRYFLQLKHSDVDKHLEVDELINLLTGWFRSYCKISEVYKEDKTCTSEFIIYTNRNLEADLSQHNKKDPEVDVFFKTCESKVFIFTPDKNKDRDVYTLLENSVKRNEKHMVSKFLNKLIMATGQKGYREIDALIIKEIRNQDTFIGNRVGYNTILHHFKTLIENWWRKKKTEPMTPKMLKTWLQRAKAGYFTPSINCLYRLSTQKLLTTNTRCSGKEVSNFRTKISNSRAVHLTSDAPTLCSILLMDCVPKSKGIFVTLESLQSNKNFLLHAWLGGHWEWLIVFCNSTVRKLDISDTCHDIYANITRANLIKRVIILTARSVPQITDFVLIKQEFEIEQLSERSQEMVLDQKINFQGCEVTMRSVLQRHGNVQHVLGRELLTDMISEETAVSIGGRLQVNEGYYAPRFLKRNIWLSVDILRRGDTYPDIFAMSGMKKNDLVDIVPSDEEVGDFRFNEDSVTENSTQDYGVSKKRFIVLQGRDLKSSFSKLCENRSRETVHWLKHKHGKLLWKETRGEIQNLLKYIDAENNVGDMESVKVFMKRQSCEVEEDSIWDLGERTVLLVAEPGMGKSSTTTQVAWRTKERDHTSWVVPINWNDHTEKLQEIIEETFNIDSLVKFLCSAAFPESKYRDIEEILLKQALQNSGNILVLMDGFDEISPTHAKKADAILSALKESKEVKVWVTSRPVAKDRLERKLSVIAWSMKKLSRKSQEEMFWDNWKERTNMEKETFLDKYVRRILSQANEAVYQRNFTGCPLYFTTIVSAFKDFLQKSLEEKEITLPRNLDLSLVCDQLVTSKLDTYGKDKKREDLTNASVQDDKENLKEMTIKNLEKCSLLVTLPSQLNEQRDEKIQPFITRVKEGKDKIGIVMNVVEDRPQFVHKIFADYFTASWFSKKYMSNTSVLERILFDTSYGIVKVIFDRILAKGCDLHCAVLNWDTETVESLLQGDQCVNGVDKGGRTALHLIAAQNLGDEECEEITSSLLQRKASVCAEDNVLHFTPLSYAIKAENWLVVERLLENPYKENDLELIRQRVDDECYIRKIIFHAADKKYSSLLHFLESISANTIWAPLLDAVAARN
jgi:hypothetical protein